MSQNPEPSPNLLASAPAEANVNAATATATAPVPPTPIVQVQGQAPAAAAASETDATDRPVSSPRSPHRATSPSSSPHPNPLELGTKQALDPHLSRSLNLESHSSMATPQSSSAVDSPSSEPAQIMDSGSPGPFIKEEASSLDNTDTKTDTRALEEREQQQQQQQQKATEPVATTATTVIPNGHVSIDSPAEPVPVKRGPGRPPRSQMASTPVPAVDTSSDSTSRPRRTPRAVTVSPISGSPVTLGQNIYTTRSQDSTPAVITPEAANPGRMAGQRTSSRQIRTPGKFLTDFSPAPVSTKANTVKATPSNQRPLLNQQPAQEPPRKRGPGRPVTNPNSIHRSAAVAKSAPPSPPPVIPLKRGPGRPPRNPLSVKATPHVVNTASTGSRTKSKSASPTMIRSSNHATINGSRSSTAASTPKSPTSAASEPVTVVRRGPGRPPRSSDSANSSPSSSSPTSSHWKYPTQTQIVIPGSSPTSSRSRKRYNKSEAEEEDAPGSPDGMESGFPLRKRRVVSLINMSTSSQSSARSKPPPPPEPPKPPTPPKPLTPLDRLRQAKVVEQEGKLHEVIDHHDSLARELYHLETYTTMLTYDPVKIKSDHSEKMIRVC